MKVSDCRAGGHPMKMVFFLSLLMLLFSVTAVCAQGPGPDYMQVRPGSQPVVESYSGVSDLVDRVSREAMSRFYDFFGPVMVNVEPFVLIDRYPRTTVSQLGLILADQMVAHINNDSVSRPKIEGEAQPQWLFGLLQEIDGHLRVHIYGVNMRGERRSCVVTVEMSEPVYRALYARVGY